jgi:hypothetical protein
MRVEIMNFPDISGSDLNDLKITGWYKGENFKNAPIKGHGYLWHVQHGPALKLFYKENEQAIKINGVLYYRAMMQGLWSKWMIVNKDGLWEEIKP